jgi:hypothetical protein
MRKVFASMSVIAALAFAGCDNGATDDDAVDTTAPPAVDADADVDGEPAVNGVDTPATE